MNEGDVHAHSQVAKASSGSAIKSDLDLDREEGAKSLGLVGGFLLVLASHYSLFSTLLYGSFWQLGGSSQLQIATMICVVSYPLVAEILVQSSMSLDWEM